MCVCERERLTNRQASVEDVVGVGCREGDPGGWAPGRCRAGNTGHQDGPAVSCLVGPTVNTRRYSAPRPGDLDAHSVVRV